MASVAVTHGNIVFPAGGISGVPGFSPRQSALFMPLSPTALAARKVLGFLTRNGNPTAALSRVIELSATMERFGNPSVSLDRAAGVSATLDRDGNPSGSLEEC